MKKLIGLGTLLTGTLFFAGNAQAGLFDWFCRRPCPPEPTCPPAATARVQGRTTYTAAYQAPTESVVAPARDSGRGMPSPSMDRTQYLWEYQKYRQGRR